MKQKISTKKTHLIRTCRNTRETVTSKNGNTIQQHTEKSYPDKGTKQSDIPVPIDIVSTFTKNLNALQSDIDPQNIEELD